MRAISKKVLSWLGWRCDNQLPKHLSCVVIGAPHTSNWDFPFGVMAMYALDLPFRWVGKHTLFRWPFGGLFRALGGMPVDRRQANGFVGQAAALFQRSEPLMLVMAPEGTRTKTPHWKSGFYHIATTANVPIALGYIDVGQKTVGIGELIYPTGDIHADFQKIREFYKNKTGFRPENQSDISVKPKK